MTFSTPTIFFQYTKQYGAVAWRHVVVVSRVLLFIYLRYDMHIPCTHHMAIHSLYLYLYFTNIASDSRYTSKLTLKSTE